MWVLCTPCLLDTFSRKDESTLFLGCELESAAKITTRTTKILPIDPRISQQVHHHLLLISIDISEYFSWSPQDLAFEPQVQKIDNHHWLTWSSWSAQLKLSWLAHFAQLMSALASIMLQWPAPVICLNPKKQNSILHYHDSSFISHYTWQASPCTVSNINLGGPLAKQINPCTMHERLSPIKDNKTNIKCSFEALKC